jgi:hypothetical protein
MKMENKKTGQTDYVQKIRGITYDVQNEKSQQFNAFLRRVLDYGKDEQRPALFRYDKIQPTRDSRIITRPLIKRYLPVCQKGIINSTYDVFPFGYE